MNRFYKVSGGPFHPQEYTMAAATPVEAVHAAIVCNGVNVSTSGHMGAVFVDDGNEKLEYTSASGHMGAVFVDDGNEKLEYTMTVRVTLARAGYESSEDRPDDR